MEKFPSTTDFLATVTIYSNECGGRQTPTPLNKFGCPLLFKPDAGQAWDCKMWLRNTGSLHPGSTYHDVPVELLSPDIVMPMLNIGTELLMWEGKIIGKLVVTMLFLDEEKMGRHANLFGSNLPPSDPI